MGFQIFQFPKIDFHLESISKTRLTNNQKHSAHRFVDNYLTSHFEKFLQYRIKP